MDLLLAVLTATDPVPEPEDVRAGWTAFWLFLALGLATALLLWSFVRQIRKTRANAARGVFGPVDDAPTGAPTDAPGPAAAPGAAPDLGRRGADHRE